MSNQRNLEKSTNCELDFPTRYSPTSLNIYLTCGLKGKIHKIRRLLLLTTFLGEFCKIAVETPHNETPELYLEDQPITQKILTVISNPLSDKNRRHTLI